MIRYVTKKGREKTGRQEVDGRETREKAKESARGGRVASGHSRDGETDSAGKAETFSALLAASRRVAGERSTGKTRFPN